MARTILKNNSEIPLDLDGTHVIVKNAQNKDTSLETELATLRASVQALAACSDALLFKGIATTTNPLPTANYKAGWTFKIGESGIYAGQQCEVGDMAICVRDWNEATATGNDWQIVQTNIDGAVTGPASSVSGNMAEFSGTSGKIIADSGLKKEELAQAVEMKHLHVNSGTLTLLGQDTDGNLTFSGQLVGNREIDCAVIQAGDPLPDNLAANAVIFEIQGS